MQKYFIFGLMAMLAACSSDSGGGLNDGWMNYRNNGVPTNNDAITTMINKGDFSLADADFTLSNNNANFGKNMKFSVDDKGIVTALRFSDGTTASDTAAKGYTTYLRSGNSTLFFPANTESDIKKISIGSGGKENKLQYSDFGTIVFGDYNKNMYYATYTGGYDSTNKIDNPNVNGMTFKGNARGYVYGRDGDALHISGTATLSGNGESLEANFSNWYTVNIDNNVMKFTGYKFNPNNPDIDSDKYNNPNKDKDKDNYAFRNETESGTDYEFTKTYYGDNGTPSEVVGSFSYEEKLPDGATGSAIRLDAAFGGVKQP